MLVNLSIHDVVLIDRLELTFQPGLCVLTGETGAGKSILLDALGFALGRRAEAGLVRPGAAQATVTAGFEVDADHPALAILDEQAIDAPGRQIILRRALRLAGRGRAFVNDQPVSVALLRRLGDTLVEIQGQFEQRGLLDPASHRDLLDTYGALDGAAKRLGALWQDWRRAADAREAALGEREQARRDEAFLRDALSELEALDPRPGEARDLAAQRAVLMNAEKLTEAMNEAAAALAGSGGAAGADKAVGDAARALRRIADKAAGRLDPALAALDNATVEIAEALAQLAAAAADMETDSARLEHIEGRYFALRDLARKHGVEVDDLGGVREAMAARLAAIEESGDRLAGLERAADDARAAYVAAADSLSRNRQRAAEALDRAVGRELPPLKLDKAVFRTRLARLEEAAWGAHGMDRIVFEVATNPGAAPGPLAKIASGGELSRFLLALKVILAEAGGDHTLVFDEVDSGVGGATAHAVGQRLARLAGKRQVLVVTHSPQVGARGTHHLRVRKESRDPKGTAVTTRVRALDPDERREEIARMLSGAEVTEEARAAARRLMEADAR